MSFNHTIPQQKICRGDRAQPCIQPAKNTQWGATALSGWIGPCPGAHGGWDRAQRYTLGWGGWVTDPVGVWHPCCECLYTEEVPINRLITTNMDLFWMCLRRERSSGGKPDLSTYTAELLIDRQNVKQTETYVAEGGFSDGEIGCVGPIVPVCAVGLLVLWFIFLQLKNENLYENLTWM